MSTYPKSTWISTELIEEVYDTCEKQNTSEGHMAI